MASVTIDNWIFDSEANFQSLNPVIPSGMITVAWGATTATNKEGDGVTAYNSLPRVLVPYDIPRQTFRTAYDVIVTQGSRITTLEGAVWNYVIQGTTFTTNSTSAVDVTDLAFSPSASTGYEVEGMLYVRSSSALCAPRVGLAWPSNLTDGIGKIQTTGGTLGVLVMDQGNINSSLLTAVGSVFPTTTQSYPCVVNATFFGGASVGGSFKIQLASSVVATNVSCRLNSFIRYRSIS